LRLNSILPKIKILIVDDKPENLLTLQAVFKESGYVLIEALSGKEALELARHHEFACILLDVQMPGLNGFETAKVLRTLPKAENTPIIFVTAIDRNQQFEEMGYIAGAIDYLFKPLNPTILKAKVSIFVDMFLQTEEIKRKNFLLEEAIVRSKENEELKKALKTRDEFLAMAGHELKTPITPLYLQMQAFLQLYESGAVAKIDPEKLIRMIKTSNNQLERLSRLIQELVDVSKIASNKLEMNFKETSLNTIVQKVISDFDTEIKKSNCVVSLSYHTEVRGLWDEFRIEQVIVNLLTNALKYGAEKPVIIEVRAHNSEAVFSIKDFGIGIGSEDQSKIFERFERAVSAKSYNGLGLGLFIVKEILELHQGKIRVESQLDHGSTFYVSLPSTT
jgi:signal transduction histidine kinase